MKCEVKTEVVEKIVKEEQEVVTLSMNRDDASLLREALGWNVTIPSKYPEQVEPGSYLGRYTRGEIHRVMTEAHAALTGRGRRT